jgi:preprotein translocase subunit YajC
MINSSAAEVYFIGAMMFLILIICAVSLFFFFRTYQREKQNKEKLNKKASLPKDYAEK